MSALDKVFRLHLVLIMIMQVPIANDQRLIFLSFANRLPNAIIGVKAGRVHTAAGARAVVFFARHSVGLHTRHRIAGYVLESHRARKPGLRQGADS